MTTDSRHAEGSTIDYLHGSLYIFSPAARLKVIDNFYSKAGNVAANCSYNTKEHLFALACPRSQGGFCNEILGEVIGRYVEEERNAAWREGRVPEVQSFSGALLEEGLECDEGHDIGPESATNEHPSPVERVRPVKAHIVLASEREGKRLKFFQMHQLPESFMRRALTDGTAKVQHTFVNGWTCRTVCWKAGEGYVFNGRDGSTSLNVSDVRPEIDLPEFPVLHDTRDQATLDVFTRKAAEAVSIGHKHVTPGPAVQEWLHEVDQTAQVKPEEAGELPKETRKMMAADEMHVIGRARVPKGYRPRMEEQDGDSDNEPANPTIKPDFAAALLSGASGTGHLRDDSSDSETSPDSGSTTKAAIVAEPTLGFASLLPKNGTNGPQENSAARPAGAKSQTLDSRTTHATLSGWTNPLDTLPTMSRSTAEKSIEFSQYDKNYTKIDRSGLTADPRLIAAWNIENNAPSPVKHQKRRTVMPRVRQTPSQTGESLEGTVSSARSLLDQPIPSGTCKSTCTTTAHSQAQNVFLSQWEQNVGRQTVSTAQLVDVTERSSETPLGIPPGLVQPFITREPQTPSAHQAGRVGLIDTAEVYHEDTSPLRAIAASRGVYGETTQTTIATGTRAADDEEAPCKLAVFPPGFDTKRYTMNQRAGKNIKSKGKKPIHASGKKPNVELPLPDPVPAPRVRQVVEAPQRTPMARSPVQHEEQSRPNSFQKLLLETVNRIAAEEEDDGMLATLKARKLFVQVGQILLVPKEQSFGRQEASTSEVMQDLMASSTVASHFYPRLTTSVSDAKFIIELIKAVPIPTLIYDVRIKDAANVTLKCMIPANGKEHFQVMTTDHALGHEYLHYPVHVWDARVSLVQPGKEQRSPSHEAIKQFVASMETSEPAPSFCAHIPDGQFVVEAVFALRVFENVEDDLTRRVTEKRLLKTQQFRGVIHNFQAIASPDVELIEDHGVWWEATLETDDLKKREELHTMAAHMVVEMNGVGSKNVGRWTAPGVYEDEKNATPALLYDALGRDHLAKSKSRC